MVTFNPSNLKRLLYPFIGLLSFGILLVLALSIRTTSQITNLWQTNITPIGMSVVYESEERIAGKARVWEQDIDGSRGKLAGSFYDDRDMETTPQGKSNVLSLIN